MGGIVSQADQYGVFDTGPRHPREHVAREAPIEIIAEYTRGPSIGVGQLNPRGIQRQAVYTDDIDPDEHAYKSMPIPSYDPAEGWFRNPGGHYEAPDGFESREEQAAEEVDADDESGYNWGPTPHHDVGAEPGPHPDFHDGLPNPFGTPSYNPGGGYSDRPPSFSAARRHTADDGPGDQGLVNYDDPRREELFTPMYFHEKPPDQRSLMLGAAPGPVLLPHYFAPGHRVGLPYQNSVISGTVTHLRPDTQVGIRWDDGQHSVEAPGDVHRL